MSARPLAPLAATRPLGPNLLLKPLNAVSYFFCRKQMQSFNHALEEMRMKFHSSKNLALIFLTVGLLTCPIADATEADDTTIDITGHTAGSTPFISQVALLASQTERP